MGGVILGRDAILGAKDRGGETVLVPEWGGSVCIAVMSGAARDAFRAMVGESAAAGQDGKPASDARLPVSQFEATLLSLTLVDKDGKALFTLEDVEALQGKAAAVLDRLAAVALRINGMAANSQEDAAKN